MPRHHMINGEHVPFTAEEEAARDAEEAAWAAGETGRQSAAVRQERDKMLVDSDYTQVADAPADKGAWAAYRQALRDVPAQAGFPENVQWPEKPQ